MKMIQDLYTRVTYRIKSVPEVMAVYKAAATIVSSITGLLPKAIKLLLKNKE